MAYAQKLSANRHLDLLARDKDHARDILPCHDNYFRQMILKSYSYEPERKHALLLPLHKVYVSSVTLTLSQRHGFAFNTLSFRYDNSCKNNFEILQCRTKLWVGHVEV